MIWLTWRQFRAQAIVTAVAVAVVGALLVITGVQLSHLADSTGFAACRTGCDTVASHFISAAKAGIYVQMFYAILALLFLAPALIGIFWGAPLVTREVETGTFRLAWNQSITRTRWLAAKIGLIGLTAMVTAGLLSLLASWWASPIDRAIVISGSNGTQSGFSRLDPLVFAARGIAPIGYAAFAFALGVAAGVFLRRTVPAMAATLAGFAFVQLAWPNWIRPHLISPVTFSAPLNPANVDDLMVSQPSAHMTVVGAWSQHGAWVLSNQSVTPAGHVFIGPATQACLGNSQQACNAWLANQHLRQLVIYEPASRFWEFQVLETGIFLILALALAALCARHLSRRRLA